MSVTPPTSSNGDEDLDIYADLPDVNVDSYKSQQLQLSEQYQALKEELSRVSSNLESLRKSNKKLLECNRNLSCNISVLYKTAAFEIGCKDQVIAELNRELDNVIFRRADRKSAFDLLKRSSNDSNSQFDAELTQINENQCVGISPPILTQSSSLERTSAIKNSAEGLGSNDGKMGELLPIKSTSNHSMPEAKVQSSIRAIPKKRKIEFVAAIEENSIGLNEKLAHPGDLSHVTFGGIELKKKSVWQRLGNGTYPFKRKLETVEAPIETAATSTKLSIVDNMIKQETCQKNLGNKEASKDIKSTSNSNEEKASSFKKCLDRSQLGKSDRKNTCSTAIKVENDKNSENNENALDLCTGLKISIDSTENNIDITKECPLNHVVRINPPVIGKIALALEEPIKDQIQDLKSNVVEFEKKSDSLHLVPQAATQDPNQSSNFQPPLPDGEPTPLPPLPLTTPPPTPIKSILVNGNTEHSKELPSCNTNLLMQCTFKPRRRVKSLILLEDAVNNPKSKEDLEPHKTDSQSQSGMPLNSCKSPDTKQTKHTSKKHDVYDNRPSSSFRSLQGQRSVYNSRYLSSVKSFAHMPERRSPSELLSGRSGRIERLPHEDRIRVRLRDRRSRSLSPQGKRVRQDSYRTSNGYRDAPKRECNRRILSRDSNFKSEKPTESRDSNSKSEKPTEPQALRKTKSLSLKKKPPSKCEEEELKNKVKQSARSGSKVTPTRPKEKNSMSPKFISKRAYQLTDSVNLEVTGASLPQGSPKKVVKSPVGPNELRAQALSSVEAEKKTLEETVIVVRRRPRSSIRLENSENCSNASNVVLNHSFKSSEPLTDGQNRILEPMKNSKALTSFESIKHNSDRGHPKLSEKAPLYFREQTGSKHSTCEDSDQFLESSFEGDGSPSSTDSDVSYNPCRKSSKKLIKRKSTKRSVCQKR